MIDFVRAANKTCPQCGCPTKKEISMEDGDIEVTVIKCTKCAWWN